MNRMTRRGLALAGGGWASDRMGRTRAASRASEAGRASRMVEKSPGGAARHRTPTPQHYHRRSAIGQSKGRERDRPVERNWAFRLPPPLFQYWGYFGAP